MRIYRDTRPRVADEGARPGGDDRRVRRRAISAIKPSLRLVAELARARGLSATVLTFDRHPAGSRPPVRLRARSC